MNSKEKILSKIKNLPIKNFTLQREDPVVHIKSYSDDLVEEYIARTTENKANVIKTNLSNLEKNINEIIQKENVKNLIYPNGLPINLDEIKINNKFKFDKPIESFKTELFNYDTSIINANSAVSSHGVFCVISSKIQPRLLSLTPKLCIVLLKKENIVKSLSAAFNDIKKQNETIPTNILFISGPSRTSDIELKTVMGVHGSQIVYVLVY